MKKTFFAIVISLISSATFAQVGFQAEQTEREKLAGIELKKFANHHYLGTGFSVGGGIMIVAGYSMMMKGQMIISNAYPGTYYNSQLKNGQNKIITGTYLSWTGQLLTLAGLVYKIEAPMHVKRAGLILSGDRVAITIKLSQSDKIYKK